MIENEIWRLYSNVPIGPTVKHKTDIGKKISTKLTDYVDLALSSPPLLV